MNKVTRLILFIIYLIWNIPIWIIYNILGDDNLWNYAFQAYRKMIKGRKYYE